MQRFKSIYFSDFPADSPKRRNLKIAFGADHHGLYEKVKTLSSEEIRRLLGSTNYTGLKKAADSVSSSLNAYCLAQLDAATTRNKSMQLSLLPESSLELDRLIDPIQTTFRGGLAEPLHDWYPYLEGYSPDFVSSVLKAFAPDAVKVLDPFAGTGTTPLTTARLGLQGFYAELNPLLQYLIEAKTHAISAPSKDRLELAEHLSILADQLPKTISSYPPDHRLRQAYTQAFNESKFFGDKTFEDCLRLRNWIDDLHCSEPRIASLATIAVIASLIPCSNMIRRGDLRFRKGKELDSVVQNIVTESTSRLNAIAADIANLETVGHPPQLVAADAKRLDRVASLNVDAVVTSPPYLNGTNYYRNTKIELWFLRALNTKQDLSNLRKQTVTAGINDVAAGDRREATNETVKQLVKDLKEGAYDRRIPQMASSYFSDMRRVFTGLLHHSQPGAALLVDIGDSAYAGVHVDTPAILAELLEHDGWAMDEEVVLRERVSRNGESLRQTLLVARAPKRRTVSRSIKPDWRRKWNQFKRDLPHQKADFARRNWGSPLHSLCSYQGKMKPSLAHHLVRTFTDPGQKLLDPFGGVGTIPFEAAQHGVHSWSFDISPAAVPIASAKLQLHDPHECEAVIAKLDRFIRRCRPTNRELVESEMIRFNGPLSNYFHTNTFHQILLARRFFQKNPPTVAAQQLVFACLLHILHGNRPYALSRRSHPITPFAPSGDAEDKCLIQKLRDKIERSVAAESSVDFVPGHSLFQDATASWPQSVDELDAVVTSPPFYDSTRFYSANWMRLWFAGWTPKDFKHQPKAFVDERQKQDFRVYEPILRQSRERLKLGGVCVLHLGKSQKCDMASEIAKIAKPWFDKAEVFAECVAHCESHGIRDKGTVRNHTYLVLY